jgi:hypothetical protein
MQHILPGNHMSIPQSRRKVDFLICGAQKSGTTSLHAYLQRHSDIYLPATKEIHFFDSDQYFSGNTPDYEYYHAHFASADDGRKWGEATPIYMYWEPAIPRMWAYNPEMKIIIVLRNPIERAYSHWNMETRRGMETLSFAEAIRNEAMRCKSDHGNQHRVYSYCDRGFYCKQILRLQEVFPKKNILVLKSEYLSNQPKETLNLICQFLEIKPLNDTSPIRLHALPYQEKMSEAARTYLQDLFRAEIRELEQLLQWDCSAWLEP